MFKFILVYELGSQYKKNQLRCLDVTYLYVESVWSVWLHTSITRPWVILCFNIIICGFVYTSDPIIHSFTSFAFFEVEVYAIDLDMILFFLLCSHMQREATACEFARNKLAVSDPTTDKKHSSAVRFSARKNVNIALFRKALFYIRFSVTLVVAANFLSKQTEKFIYCPEQKTHKLKTVRMSLILWKCSVLMHTARLRYECHKIVLEISPTLSVGMRTNFTNSQQNPFPHHQIIELPNT